MKAKSSCVMGVDRRTACLSFLFAATAGCAQAGGSKIVAGAISWPNFKAAFLDPSGRIIDNGNGGISHSEGQGYGMALALRGGDQAAFDTIFRWSEANLANRDTGLYAWRYDPRQPNPVGDQNNASDGDIFIAWALADAARKWKNPSYASRSAEIRRAIRSSLVLERYGRSLLLPGVQGFVKPDAVTLNPAYFIWPALDAFRLLDGDAVWGKVIADSEAIASASRFGPLHLPTDWIDISGPAIVSPASGRPARFGFDAIRVPLYAKSGRRTSLLAPVANFWQAYVGKGKPIPAWIDVESGEEAPYALSSGGMAVASRTLGLQEPLDLSADYYAAVLQMLARFLP
ncbi:glycosyl hydrolase family 8 [Sphingomonas sp. HH69]